MGYSGGTERNVWSVVLNYKNPNDTVTCVQALKKECSSIVVVDNGGSNMSYLTSVLRPGVVVVATEQNLGFAGGMNYGIRYALELGAEDIVIVNNDTVPFQGWMSALITAREIGYDIVSPIILDVGEMKIDLAGYVLSWAEVGASQVIPVNKIYATFMMIGRDTFHEVGFFDEDFFHYCEDNDYCSRAISCGKRLGYALNAFAWHRGGGTLDHKAPEAWYYHARNSLILFSREQEVAVQKLLLHDSKTRGYIVRLLLNATIHGRLGNFKWIFLGVYHALRKRLGRLK